MTATASAPLMTYVFTIDVGLQDPIMLSDSAVGRQVFIPIVGGTVKGPRLQAEILPGGGDRAVERADGGMEIHARYLIRTDDGVVVEVDNRGHWREVSGSIPYFVTAPVFSVVAGRYGWLARSVFVGMAHEVDESRVVIDVYEAMTSLGAQAESHY